MGLFRSICSNLLFIHPLWQQKLHNASVTGHEDPRDLVSRVKEIVGKRTAVPNNLSFRPDKLAGDA